MAPPLGAELPDRVLAETVTLPPNAKRPPPLAPAELPERGLATIVKWAVEKLKMAPPAPLLVLAVLPESVQPLSVKFPLFCKPPPPPPVNPTFYSRAPNPTIRQFT